MSRSPFILAAVAAAVTVGVTVPSVTGSPATAGPAGGPAALASTGGTASPSFASISPLDPGRWSDGRLAAQITNVCVDAAATSAQRSLASNGIGGITLLGRDAPSDLRSRLASVRAAAPHGVPPMISSDEEGGEVQRLANLIYPLPSAETMGTWSTTRIRDTAKDYAARMRQLGVLTDFGPVADLGIPGYFIAEQHRAFSRWPKHVTVDVKAWMSGMRASGVVTTVKHWPGHGQANDTHTGAATVPPLSTLEKRDMIPFNAAFAAGVPAVMVGHLKSDGLTDPGWPATESPKALRYLRAHAGSRILIVTDSLAMAAASSSVHLTVPQAAVRALHSGADIALTCSREGVVAAVRDALGNGHLSHAKSTASARRLLLLKARAGMLPGYSGPAPTSVTAHPGKATVPQGGTDLVSGKVTGAYRPVWLQQNSGSGWRTVRKATTGRYGYFDLRVPTSTTGLHQLRVHVPAAFPYTWTNSTAMTVTVTG